MKLTVALLTTKGKRMAMLEGLNETLWLRDLVGNLGHVQEANQVYCDNWSAIHLMKS